MICTDGNGAEMNGQTLFIGKQRRGWDWNAGDMKALEWKGTTFQRNGEQWN